MNMASYHSAHTEKLDDSNYETWKLQMRSLLIFSDLWDYVSGKVAAPKDGKDIEEWKSKDEKGLALIVLGLKESQFSYIKKAKTSNEAWKILEKVHSSKGPAKKVLLYKQLFLLKKHEDQSMAEHIRVFQSYIDQMEEIGVPIPKELASIMLLNTLPEEFENFCIAIESRDDLPEIDNLKIKLIEEESRRNNHNLEKEHKDQKNESALLSNGKYRPKQYKKKEETNNCNVYKNKIMSGKSGQIKSSKFDGTCFGCGKYGHRVSECRNKKNTHTKNKYEAMLVSAVDIHSNSVKTNKWCLDSGATAHMCNNENLFVQWKNKVISKVQTAGSESIEASGVGTVAIELVSNSCNSVSELILKNTMFVPEIKYNLISVSSVTENGFNVIFNKNEAFIKRKDGTTVLKAVKCGKLYMVNTVKKISMLSVHNSVYDNYTLKWHGRLGHLNFRDMRKLENENLVDGLKCNFSENKVDCLICSKGKICQIPFKKSDPQECEILDVVHSDICGPMTHQSLGGARYFVTFIDNKSRFVYLAILKKRSDVFEAFKDYLLYAERQTGKRLKCIRTDNAKEYKSREFNEYLKKNGIRRQFSLEYTPQQNGVSERMNRTLMDMVRCMLIESQMPKSLWAEAVNTAVFIRNRCPTTAVNNKTPYELWYGKKPHVGFMKTFGCKAVALEKGPNKSKLNAKGKVYKFVGYSEESKGYRLWDGIKTVVVRRDVKFFEVTNPKNYVCASIFRGNDAVMEDEDQQYDITPEKGNTFKNDVDDNYDLESEFATPISLEEGDMEKTEPDVDSEDENSEIDNFNKVKRKPGRPRILRTGGKGRPRKIFAEEVNFVIENTFTNPISFEDAMNSDDNLEWKQAMKSELKSLENNETWKLVKRPKDKKIISNRWVFCKKLRDDGTIAKFKARLVARGCEQHEGIDYNEIYAPVARYETIRLLFALSVEREMFLHHMDVTSAFVQGDLSEDIYMEQPKYPDEGLNKKSVDMVCKLLKPLYGLKQAGHQWHKKLDGYLKALGMNQMISDQCAYEKTENGKKIILVIYVDDLLIAGHCLEMIKDMKRKLAAKFEMKDLGQVKNILGITVERKTPRGEIRIHQKQYIQKILIKFGMEDAKPVVTPIDSNQNILKISDIADVNEDKEYENKPYRELIGALMYLSNTTRPDIAFATNILSRFCGKHKKIHWIAAKRVLRYLKGTLSYCIRYRKTDFNELCCYTDSDWASDQNDRRSCSGYIIKVADGPICWRSRKQRSVALSTMEAEYMALSEVTKEIIHLRRLLAEFGFKEYCIKGTTIFCDSQSAIKVSKGKGNHDRSKHIDIRYHFCQEKQAEGVITVTYISTDNMAADILTKSLDKKKFLNCIELLGLENDV